MVSSKLLNMTTSASILLTIFFVLFIFQLPLNYFDVALFTVTSGPILFSISYFTNKEENVFEELIGLLFTYIFAVIFFFVLTKELNFIIVFYAILVYLLLKKLNNFLLNLVVEFTGENSPFALFISATLSALFVSFLLANLIL